MAVGGGRKVAKPGPDGMPVSVTEMTVTLSADSRVFYGQTAADFLEAFKANMEDPFRLSIV
jgi:pyruvate/2-oxoglutarate dehydrogenase complex dihydrolipoamide acyltransferase (E2) component